MTLALILAALLAADIAIGRTITLAIVRRWCTVSF